MRHVALLAALLSCGCPVLETIDHSAPALPTNPPDMPGDMRDPRDMPDLMNPTTSGVASALVIDGSVHTGVYTDGTPYEGIYGDTVRFELAAWGESAPVALAHAAAQAEAIGLRLAPDLLITHVLLEGGAGCVQERPRGGCFGLLRDPHLRELGDLWPERFGGIDTDALTEGGFGLGALAYVWRVAYAHALLGQYEADIEAYMAERAGPEEARYGFFAHVYSPYAPVFGYVFESCAESTLQACVDASGRAQTGQVDLLDAHTNISGALRVTERATGGWTRAGVEAYLQEIAPLHPGALVDLDAVFGGAASLDEAGQERLLEALSGALPGPPPPAEIRQELCRRGILMNVPGCR